MVSTISKRADALPASPLIALTCLLASAIVANPLRAQQSCDDFNECTVTDVCDASGNCKGTNKPDGTPCTPNPAGGDCVVSAACRSGLCLPSSTKPMGTACTNPLFGPCMTNGKCQFGGFCLGDLVQCPADSNLCTFEFCNPQNGECLSIPQDCNDDCSTGQCDPGTGECVNPQNRPDGTSCDDFNDCTSNDRCSGGQCLGSTTPGATATRTPTGLTALTPTATRPPATPTPSATATRTLGLPPTATKTPMATVTATATITPPAGGCVGDCGGNGEVTVDEIIKGVNIALGNLPLSDCMVLDADGNGDVTINEIIQAVSNALSGCPTPPPTHTPTVEPTATSTTPPSATPSPTLTLAPTATPTTAAPTATSTATPSPTLTVTTAPTATQTLPPTATHTEVVTQTPTLAASSTPTPPSTATQTLQVTGTPTTTASVAPTASATETVEPTATPSPTDTPESSPTAASTPTESPTPTVTRTSGPSIPQRAAGTIQSSTTALLVVPNVLSAILGHTGDFGIGSAAGLAIPIPFKCPGSIDGGGQILCSQQIMPGFPPTLGPPTYNITLNSCVVTGTAGTTLTFDGTVIANGHQGDSCLSIPSDLSVTIPNLAVTAQGTNGMTTATFTNVSGSVTLSGTDQACTYNAVSFNLVGTMSVAFKDAMGTPLGSTQVGFGQGSSIQVSVSQYGAECVPTVYNTTVQGAITFTSGGNSFAATFTNYMLHDDATSGDNLVTVSGGIASACLGAPVQLSTATPLLVLGAAPCPRAGEVAVASGGTTDLVRYTNSGGVEIDVGNNGTVNQTFDSCLDPRLFQCPSS